MNLTKLNPWNWLKHEDAYNQKETHIPVQNNKLHRELSDSINTETSNRLFEFHRDFERLFDNIWSDFGLPSRLIGNVSTGMAHNSAMGKFRASIDISGDEKCYEIKLDVPGFSDSDISIDITDRVINIYGDKEINDEKDDQHYYRIERSYGSFRRTLAVPDDANIDEINASLKDGVLKIIIPKDVVNTKDVRKVTITSS